MSLYSTHTHPLISIHELSKPYELLFLEFESFIKGWMWIGKRIHIQPHPTPAWPIPPYMLHPTPPLYGPPHSYMTHLTPLLHDPPHLTLTWPIFSLHDPPQPCMTYIHSWIFETLQVIISWVWVIHKMLNVNWKKIHSIILSLTCYSLRNFPPLKHIPCIHSWIFKTLWVIISWVWVICKRLNVNWKKFIQLHPTPIWPTPPLHDPPTHPTFQWPTPPHPTLEWPTHSTPALYDPPHPTLAWPTPLYPCMTHPTPVWPTPSLHDPPHPSLPTHHTPTWPTPPHPWYIFGHKGAFFHGLLHYVSLLVDNCYIWKVVL